MQDCGHNFCLFYSVSATQRYLVDLVDGLLKYSLTQSKTWFHWDKMTHCSHKRAYHIAHTITVITFLGMRKRLFAKAQ